MGRPKGSKNKSTLAKQLKRLEKASGKSIARIVDPLKKYSDEQIITMIRERFDCVHQMGRGATTGAVRGLIVSGAPGVGKSHTIEWLLENARQKMPDFKYSVIKGTVTAVNLYKQLYHARHERNVLVLDDADGIFFDADGVSLLKAALDSGSSRKISWLSETNALKDDKGNWIDTQFEYKGSMIFLTNIDFQKIIDDGKSKIVCHLEALMNRAIYLDLKLHGRRAVALWIRHITTKSNMLVQQFGLTSLQQKAALDYITDNRDKLRTISLREALKLGQMIKSSPASWRRTADITLLRNEV